MKIGAYIIYAVVWISTAVAVSVGLYFTHSIHCLWFMLIPTLVSIKSTSSIDNCDNHEKDEE
jgi:hypothetical protein